MIGLFVRDPSHRRLLGEVVPFLAAACAGWLAAPHLGAVGGIALGLAAWAGLSALLLRIRRRPAWRRIYRLALVLHVAFWGFQGWQASTLRAPGPVMVRGIVAGRGLAPFRAGVGEARFALGEVPLAGYGYGPRRRAYPAFGGFGAVGRLSRRLMDPAPGEGVPPRVPMLVPADAREADLGARALVALPEGGGGVPFAVVRLDLVVVDEDLVDRIRARVADLGIPAESFLVAATHTHSGPGACHAAALAELIATDFHREAVVRGIVDASEASLRAAVASARPARVAFVSSRDRGEDGSPVLARNRRRLTRDDVDDRVLGLRFDAVEGGAPIGLLLNYGVHPTLLGPTHLALDRDVAGAVEEAVARRLPGAPPVLFVNAALGDIAPRRGPEGGVAGVAALGERFAERVAPDLAGGSSRRLLRVRAAQTRRDLGSARLLAAVGSRGALDRRAGRQPLGDGFQAVADLIALPVNLLPWSLGVTEVRVAFTFDGAAAAVVRLDDFVTRTERDFGAVLLEADDDPDDETPSERRAILWLPGEATQDLGKRWRREVEAAGLPVPFLFGLTNGSIAYLTTEEEYDVAGAYEATVTLYGADSAALVGEAVFRALEAVLSSGAGR